MIGNRKPKDAGSEYEPIYKYKRLDDYERITKDISDLFREDNCGRVRITSLTISSKNYSIADSSLNYEIVFNSCENIKAFDMGFACFRSISFGVKGENRDMAELLFNDLDAYITNTIISHKHQWIIKTIKKLPLLASWTALFCVLVLTSIVLKLFTMQPRHQQDIIEKAISSTDISQKLDVLLKLHQNEFSFEGVKPIFIIVLLLIIGVSFLITTTKLKQKITSYYPFVFDFGISSENYQTRISKMKWSIGIISTLTLGILTNFLYNILSTIWR